MYERDKADPSVRSFACGCINNHRDDPTLKSEKGWNTRSSQRLGGFEWRMGISYGRSLL